MIKKPSLQRVRELLAYDPGTGEFRWKARRSNVAAGDLAGCLDFRGYRMIRIDGAYQKAHRLAWLVVHGEWPTLEIDHINGARDDNRASNLRLATVSENQQNRAAAQANSKSGHIGVCFVQREQRWVAQLSANGRRVLYRSFKTFEEARDAYLDAKRAHHPFSARLGAVEAA